MYQSNNWFYKDKFIFTPPEGYYGFIYKITDDIGNVYFGKKAFEHSQKKNISKKARKESGTRKRVERVKKDSGWLDYFGSSKPLLEYLEMDYRKLKCKREIIKLCKDKISLSYWEMVIMVQESVLFRNDCWNGNIAGKFFKGKIHL